MTKYHVTPKWDGKDLQTAADRYGEAQAIEMFMNKWETDDAAFAQDQVSKIYLYATLEEAREFQADYGGEILAIDDTYLEVFEDYAEGIAILAVRGKISHKDIVEVINEDNDDEPEVDEADEALQELIDRVAAAEDAEYLEQAMITEERRMARDYDGVNLLTVEEVAEMKECHPETVRRALRSGEFERPRKVGNGLWLLDAREVANWQPRPVGRPAAQ